MEKYINEKGIIMLINQYNYIIPKNYAHFPHRIKNFTEPWNLLKYYHIFLNYYTTEYFNESEIEYFLNKIIYKKKYDLFDVEKYYNRKINLMFKFYTTYHETDRKKIVNDILYKVRNTIMYEERNQTKKIINEKIHQKYIMDQKRLEDKMNKIGDEKIFKMKTKEMNESMEYYKKKYGKKLLKDIFNKIMDENN